MKPANTTALLALVVCAILAALLMRVRQDLEIAHAQNASLQAANRELTARVNEMETTQVDAAVLKRLQADQREAIKLRGEVATLKKSLAAAESSAAAANAAAQRAATEKSTAAASATDLSENPYARVFGRKLTANVPVGHGVVFGGWQTAPGKQGFAMAIPKPVAGSPSGQVEVETKWIEFSDAALAKVDAATLLHATSQKAMLPPEQLEAFVKSLQETSGVDVLSSPRVSVFSGRQARVSMTTATQVTPNGPIEFGPAMDLIPTLSADGTTIDLALDAKWILPTGDTTASK